MLKITSNRPLFHNLNDVGFFTFVNQASQKSAICLLADEDDTEFLTNKLPDVRIIEGTEHNPLACDGQIIVDARFRPHGWLQPQTSQTKALCLFTDVVMCFLTGSALRLAGTVTGRRYYIISTPRSGSTFLCDLLTGTNCLGRPTEHLKPWLAKYLRDADLNFSYLINGLQQYGASENGVFGSKIIVNDLFKFLPDFESEIFQEFRSSTIYFLIRGDKAAQALSNVRSDKLNIYHVHGDSGTADAAQKISSFQANLEDIFQKERWLLKQEADVLALLKEHDCVPRIISYESYTQSRQGGESMIRDMANAMNVDASGSFHWPKLAKISGEVPATDRRRYEEFRSATRLYSTCSEPWLGTILGEGWGTVQHWGVRSAAASLEIKLPPSRKTELIELLVIIGPDSPPMMTVETTELTLPNTAGQWRLLYRPNAKDLAKESIILQLASGGLNLSEIVLYEKMPEWLRAEMGTAAVKIIQT